MNRQEMVDFLNNSGLATQITNLQRAILTNMSVVMRREGQTDDQMTEDDKLKQQDQLILNSAGPSAATSAVDYAITESVRLGRFKDLKPRLNGSIVHNMQIIANEAPIGEYRNYSSILRQYLLPRTANFDFDTMVDPKHMIDMECGYPKFITPIMYRYMYDRDDVARRVNDIYPDESWTADPIVYETEDEDNFTPFETRWGELCDRYQLLQYLYRLDKLSGIGHYGVLLIGLEGEGDLEQPINEPQLLAGAYGSVGTKQRNIIYLRPFDEYLCFVQQYETDTASPRYGLPTYYNLVFVDMTISSAGAAIGTRINRRVHWSRVIHVADNLLSSLVFGVPRSQSVFNRLLDLRKIKGSSAEMFYKGGFPGISFEIDPKVIADDPEFDKDKFKSEVRSYMAGLQRYFTLVGISAKSLAVQIKDPDKHVKVHIEAISAHYGIPIRIFLGSEEGRLASSQDKLTWNQRLGRRVRTHVEPNILRAVIDRFIAIGVMPPPASKKYYVDWSDLNTTTDEDKANLSLKWTQALSQYVSTGIIHFIQPMDYMTLIMGLTPREARSIDDKIKASGGYEKLRKVDPAKSSGQNGVRVNNITKGERTGTSKSRPKKRNTADKKSEGMSS